MTPRIFLLAPLLFLLTLPAATQDYNPDLLNTYSIIARDPATGEMGIGVQSKAFAVGNRVVDAKGGLGIIAHQAVSNPMYGVIGLELLQAGMTPQDALGHDAAKRRTSEPPPSCSARLSGALRSLDRP